MTDRRRQRVPEGSLIRKLVRLDIELSRHKLDYHLIAALEHHLGIKGHEEDCLLCAPGGMSRSRAKSVRGRMMEVRTQSATIDGKVVKLRYSRYRRSL
jgi:hypothetical protein